MISPPEHSIIIFPIGNLDNSLLVSVKKEIQRIFTIQTKIISLQLDMDFALDPHRSQYHSTPILEKLASAAPPNAIKVLAIVEVDLFIPILTHVYGEAQLGGKAAILSLHRLRENPMPLGSDKSFRHRAGKEAIHELGHTFNLRHCPDRACIMHYCRTVNDVDRKSDQLCRYCKVLLEDEMKKMGQHIEIT